MPATGNARIRLPINASVRVACGRVSREEIVGFRLREPSRVIGINSFTVMPFTIHKLKGSVEKGFDVDPCGQKFCQEIIWWGCAWWELMTDKYRYSSNRCFLYGKVEEKRTTYRFSTQYHLKIASVKLILMPDWVINENINSIISLFLLSIS